MNRFTPEALREEFKKFCDVSGLNPLRSECIDWWLSQFTAFKERIRAEVEGMKKEPQQVPIPCPEGKIGCAVYHCKTIEPPENKILEDINNLTILQ